MDSLLDSWLLHLRARRRSDGTVRTYSAGVRAFMRWCAAANIEPVLDKPTVTAFDAALIDAGLEGATVAARHAAVCRFSAWIAAELDEPNSLLGLKQPKVDSKPLAPLADDELVALFKACEGKSFVDRRDAALARVMAEAFPRAEDVLSMTVSGTNVQQGAAAVIGKGTKPRILPFGAQTGVAVDRYLRVRRSHALADTDVFWLGAGGRRFGYSALYATLARRAAKAGIEGFHPHRLRRTGATRWLRQGGSESGLMAVAGWESMTMLRRYTDYTKQTRAVEEAQGLNLGDL